MSTLLGKKKRRKDQIVNFPKMTYRFDTGKSIDPYVAPSSLTYKGIQYTESESHRRQRESGAYRAGGPFYTVQQYVDYNPRHVNARFRDSSGQYEYHGPIIVPAPLPGYAGFADPFSPDYSKLDKYGADAIHAVDPTNANSQLAIDIGEILIDKRISLPGITAWKRRTEVAKAAAGEYLSREFGWKPLEEDIKSASQAISDSNIIMKHFHDNAGTLDHREFAFPDIYESDEKEIGNLTHCLYSTSASVGAFNAGQASKITQKTTTHIKRWFSGAFTYPSESTSLQKALGIGSEADKLLGISLSPDIVWELTPWTWTLDWFSNAGTVINNATSFGAAGLVMAYGYIMEEKIQTVEYSMPTTGLTNVSGPPNPVVCKYIHKIRNEANPFGFGVSWEGLSPTQLAILVALGITFL